MLQGKLNVKINVKYKGYKRWKHGISRLLSLVALIVFSPILFFIALIIKCSDIKSPVLFKQQRVGKNGVIFNMYKFRTMHVDAEEQLKNYLEENDVRGAMFKLKNDPRVTKIGKFLRKTSIDELPQLWNVVNGSMTLIGPRPPLPREVAEYTTYDKQRLTVVPGCTGLWQVSGRNELSFREMVELDLIYIKNISFKMDVKIICRTILVMFNSKGAY
ncbi:sugar transferase [Listeria booriae]|uniref:sugar transferase n=1 Tax=Listeria booriae TaxID=1552123 RepID=UPI001623DFA4|nr:sugar transferase [Listeria booriae]MBC1576049.1 sugar transferase [Listeria booriae]MBC2057997.1 sugar transferase [Listeria booriae]MBC2069383.1 sugar transferase [Listeria booriae]MBC2106579.1 sugar transferase [Listeria booriae]